MNRFPPRRHGHFGRRAKVDVDCYTLRLRNLHNAKRTLQYLERQTIGRLNLRADFRYTVLLQEDPPGICQSLDEGRVGEG
jgi:hypothetical protein